MEAALINFCAEFDVCLGPSNLCCSVIRSAVNSRPGIFIPILHEVCREKVMSLYGSSGGFVDSAMAAVHGNYFAFVAVSMQLVRGLKFLS